MISTTVPPSTTDISSLATATDLAAVDSAVAAVDAALAVVDANVDAIKAVTDSLSPGRSSAQEFTASGTFNVPTGVTAIWVTAVAPGGGGGGSSNTADYPGGGGGGSGQGVVRWPMKVTAGGTVSVTINAEGRFVTLWQDDRNENSFFEIVARGCTPGGR